MCRWAQVVDFAIHPTETDPKLLADPGRSDWTSHAHSANFDTTGRWLFICVRPLRPGSGWTSEAEGKVGEGRRKALIA